MPGQTTAAKSRAPKKTPARKAADTAPAGTGRGRARQSQPNGSATGKQGDTASGKDMASNELRGGTNQVLISEVSMTGRSGRPAGEEDYPFSMLAPAHKATDGTIVGQSFFIPDRKVADGKLAAARKRHKALFWSRTVKEQIDGKGPKVEGLRIWRGTPELADIAKR